MFHHLALAALLTPLLAKAQVLNMSRDLVAKGIANTNLSPDSPGLDARPLFEAAVAYVVQNGVRTLTADPGAYYFLSLRNPSTHSLLTSVSKLTIDWQNSDLVFHSSNTSAVQRSNCSNLVMQNFTADYQQLPFTQVTVTSVSADTQTFNFAIIPS